MNSGCSAGNGLRLVVGVDLRDLIAPPEVAAVLPGHVVSGALDDEHVGDARRALARGRASTVSLRPNTRALAVAAVGRDDELGLGVEDAGVQAVGAEASEDHGVHGADARDGEHGDDGLGDHGQVDGDAVAGLDAEAGEQVRGALHLGRELGIADVAAVAGLALPVDGDAVAVAGEHVPVEAVVGDVQLAVLEPGRERRVGPVEGLRERLVPVQLAGDDRPRIRVDRRRHPRTGPAARRTGRRTRGSDGIGGSLRGCDRSARSLLLCRSFASGLRGAAPTAESQRYRVSPHRPLTRSRTRRTGAWRPRPPLG